MSVGEAASVFGELIERGGLHQRRAVAAEIAVADVIGEDEDNVRLFGSGERRGECKERRGEEGADSHWAESYTGYWSWRVSCQPCF